VRTQVSYLYKLLNLRVVSGTSAAVQYSTSAAINAACSQLAQSINFDRVVNVLVELGATTILEIGHQARQSRILCISLTHG
jgi:hypothetical protein